MLSMAIIELGITEQYFWSITPAKLFYLSRRLNIKMYNYMYQVAAFHASFINANSKKDASTVTAEKLLGPNPLRTITKVHPNEIMKAFELIFPREGET